MRRTPSARFPFKVEHVVDRQGILGLVDQRERAAQGRTGGWAVSGSAKVKQQIRGWR